MALQEYITEKLGSKAKLTTITLDNNIKVKAINCTIAGNNVTIPIDADHGQAEEFADSTYYTTVPNGKQEPLYIGSLETDVFNRIGKLGDAIMGTPVTHFYSDGISVAGKFRFVSVTQGTYYTLNNTGKRVKTMLPSESVVQGKHLVLVVDELD